MDRLLSGKVSMVTGAASGIGRAVALGLSREGSAVAIVDKDEAGLVRVATEIAGLGGQPFVLTLDLKATASCSPAVEKVVEALGRLDILVNGAGVDVGQVNFLEMEETAWTLAHTVNLKAPMLLMQAAGRRMVKQGEGGRIVNVTSSAAFRAGKGMAAYASAKAGLTQLTRNVAAELGAHGISVNAVAPGATVTPMALRWFKERSVMEEACKEGGLVANLLQRIADPEDVAAAVIFLCLPASKQITAQTIHTSSGTIV